MMQVDKKAVFLDMNTLDRDDLSRDNFLQVVPGCQFKQGLSREQVESLIADAEIAISNKVVLDRDLLQKAKALKLICVAATGTNNVDLAAARELGIDVCNVTGYATPSVVQYVFTVMLNLMSRVPEYHQAVHRGEWSNSELFCLLNFSFHELQSKILGIYGYGELGQAVARAAQAFGMKVLVARRDNSDQREGRVDFEELLSQADVVSLHCPLTPETENLVGEREFGLMKPGAILINSARGGVVNEAALMDAIRSGKLGGAATDVLTVEPPPADHPLLTFQHERLIVTPHIAWASVEARQRLLDQVALNIQEYFSGRPRNVVN